MEEKLKVTGGSPILRDDTEIEYSENVLARLTQLESFVRGLMDAEKAFVSWTEDEDGKTVEHSISQLEAFEATFSGPVFLDNTSDELRGTLKTANIVARDEARRSKAISEAQEAKVKAYKESEAIKVKELEALKAEGAKKQRAAYEIRQKKELERIAIEAKEKEVYRKKQEEEGFLGRPIEED